jgi:hypothetical protein
LTAPWQETFADARDGDGDGGESIGANDLYNFVLIHIHLYDEKTSTIIKNMLLLVCFASWQMFLTLPGMGIGGGRHLGPF